MRYRGIIVRRVVIKPIEVLHHAAVGTEVEHRQVYERHREHRATEAREVVPAEVVVRIEVQTALAAISRTEDLPQAEVPIALREVAVQVRGVVEAIEVLEVVVLEVREAFEVPVVHHVHPVHGLQEEEVVVEDSKPKLKINENIN